MATLVREIINRGIPGMANGQQPTAESISSQKLKLASCKERSDVLHLVECRESGWSETEAEEKLAEFGPNEVVQEKTPPWYVQLLSAFTSPFIIVLIVIACISLLTDVILAPTPADRDYTTVLVISTLILLSTLIGFVQEYRSNKAADRLKSMVTTTATVMRDGLGKTEIDIKQIVPGDIVLLSAGDMIPADMRVLQSKDLFISQAMLTGESLPVEKKEASIGEALTKPVLELENICFMGTNVVSGSAVGVVINTANHTYFGSIAKAISGKRAETSFDKGVSSVSWLLIRFMLVMVPLVFVINGVSKHDWVNAFTFALSVAVGLTPAMLPMIVTANLAKGAVNMSKRKVVVKRLNAIQNIGAMDILCTDKTGTLTLDKIVLERYLNVYGNDDDEVLKWAYLNSYHQTGLKSLLDVAVLQHFDLRTELKVDEDYVKVDEIPFDFHRRRMSVILEQKNDKHLLICKGAVEEMLEVCTHAIDPGEDSHIQLDRDEIIPLDETLKQKIVATTRKLNEDGLRVLLVAIKEYEERPLTYSVSDESKMILTGFIGFLDPPKPSAKESIAALQKLGVSVKVLTGDNEVVTKKVCREVGIPVNNILLGGEVEAMSDEELKTKIDDVSILAKLSPIQKSRIVKLLQAKGHTVGFLGDGINDAAALRDADVGISVDTAVDIAKESADIILLENDLMVLRKGVIYGRRTFGNIIKYIKMAVSSNFGNMFSVLGASIFLPFLPMLPLHILIQNLLYDISQIAIPWDKMDREFIETPRKWDASGIKWFTLFVGPTSSIFDYATFGIMWYFYGANSPEKQTLFQSGWFVEGLITQTLIIHIIRTNKIPFIQSWATLPVVALTTLIIGIGIYIPFSPLASAFKLQALPPSYFLWLTGMVITYCALTQVVKNWYIRRFGVWL